MEFKIRKRYLRILSYNVKLFLLGTAVIMIWRWIWNFLDDYFLPDNFILSNILTIIIWIFIIFIYDYDMDTLIWE